MNKQEYLAVLGEQLECLNKEEADKHIEKYTKIIEQKGENYEQEMVDKLESPHLVAKKILDEYRKIEKKAKKSKRILRRHKRVTGVIFALTMLIVALAFKKEIKDDILDFYVNTRAGISAPTRVNNEDTYDAKLISSIQVDARNCEICFMSTRDDDFLIEYDLYLDKDDLDVKLNDGVLSIKTPKTSSYYKLSENEKTQSVLIFVPRKLLDRIEVNNDKGTIYMDRCDVKNYIISGQETFVDIYNSTIHNCDISTTSRYIEIKGAVMDVLTINSKEAGIGATYLLVKEKADINTSQGNVKLTLIDIGKNYSVDANIRTNENVNGKVNLFGMITDYSGSYSSQNGEDNNKVVPITINTSLKNIDVGYAY